MFVNKRWFNFYLSQVYRSISIDLSTSDKKLDKILHSKLNVGKWVERISFKSLEPSNELNQLRPNDLLHLLMKQTPNVQEVEFSPAHSFNAASWTYFSIVLMSNSYRKLRILPEITGGDLIYSAHYFTCAYHLRLTLKSLNLTLGMTNAANYNILENFPALEILNIGKGMVNDIEDLNFALESLPNLKGIAASFSNNPVDPLRSKLKGHYPNITEITLNNFTPSQDTELVAFTKSFTNLAKLNIIGRKDSPWPANEIDPTIIKEFFDFLNSIPDYQITVTGDSYTANLLEKWSNSIKRVRKDSLAIGFSIDPYENNPGHVSLTIKNDKHRSTAIFRHSNQNHSAGLNALESIKNTVTCVKLSNLSTNDGRQGSGINALFQINCPNLETLILENVRLFLKLSSMTPPNLYLELLEFYNCSFEITSLKSFSKQFQSLDYVSFDQCSFITGNNAVTIINMSNCTVKAMYISGIEAEVGSRYKTVTATMGSFFMVSVYFATKNLKKDYAIIDNNFMELTNTTYDMICSKFIIGEILNISIQVKSIQNLFIQPEKGSEYIVINF